MHIDLYRQHHKVNMTDSGSSSGELQLNIKALSLKTIGDILMNTIKMVISSTDLKMMGLYVAHLPKRMEI